MYEYADDYRRKDLPSEEAAREDRAAATYHYRKACKLAEKAESYTDVRGVALAAAAQVHATLYAALKESNA